MIGIPHHRLNVAVQSSLMSAAGFAVASAATWAATGSVLWPFAFALTWWCGGLGWKVDRPWSPFLVALAYVLAYLAISFAGAPTVFAWAAAMLPALAVAVLDRPTPADAVQAPVNWRAMARGVVFAGSLLLMVLGIVWVSAHSVEETPSFAPASSADAGCTLTF